MNLKKICKLKNIIDLEADSLVEDLTDMLAECKKDKNPYHNAKRGASKNRIMVLRRDLLELQKELHKWT
jgi:hypothetical protein